MRLEEVVQSLLAAVGFGRKGHNPHQSAAAGGRFLTVEEVGEVLRGLDNLDASVLSTALGDEGALELLRRQDVPARRALEAALVKCGA